MRTADGWTGTMTPPKKVYLVMRGLKPIVIYARKDDADIYVQRNDGEHEIIPVMMIDNAAWALLDS